MRFAYKYVQQKSFQPWATVAYPLAEGYTRITEYTKLPFQDAESTLIAEEYPLPVLQGNDLEAYYPIPTDESEKSFRLYADQANKISNLFLCGRLANYRYFNMDQALENAFEVHEKVCAFAKEHLRR